MTRSIPARASSGSRPEHDRGSRRTGPCPVLARSRYALADLVLQRFPRRDRGRGPRSRRGCLVLMEDFWRIVDLEGRGARSARAVGMDRMRDRRRRGSRLADLGHVGGKSRPDRRVTVRIPRPPGSHLSPPADGILSPGLARISPAAIRERFTTRRLERSIGGPREE
jgi:hypothetical protein